MLSRTSRRGFLERFVVVTAGLGALASGFPGSSSARAAAVAKDGFVVLGFEDPLPPYVTPIPRDALPVLESHDRNTHSTANVRDLRTIDDVRTVAPAGMRLPGRETEWQFLGGEHVRHISGKTAWTSYAMELSSSGALITMTGLRYFPSPYPLWPGLDSEGDVVEVQEDLGLPTPGFSMVSSGQAAFWWIAEGSLYMTVLTIRGERPTAADMLAILSTES